MANPRSKNVAEEKKRHPIAEAVADTVDAIMSTFMGAGLLRSPTAPRQQQQDQEPAAARPDPDEDVKAMLRNYARKYLLDQAFFTPGDFSDFGFDDLELSRRLKALVSEGVFVEESEGKYRLE